MFKTCKFSLFDSRSTDDLCKDDDEQPNVALFMTKMALKKVVVTKSLLKSLWKLLFQKAKLSETKSRQGVKCLRYNARSNPKTDETRMKFKNALQQSNLQMGASIMAGDNSSIKVANT